MPDEHTPGPWQAWKAFLDGRWRVGTAKATIATLPAPGEVPPNMRHQLQPNARLMAAAPELRQMLADLRRRFVQVSGQVCGYRSEYRL